MRRFAAICLAALATVILAAPAGAEEKVGLFLGDEALRRAVDDALVDAKVVPSRDVPVPGPDEARALHQDEKAASAKARELAEAGSAEWLVTGHVDAVDERETDTGSVSFAEVHLAVTGGKSGQRTLRVDRREKGSAGDLPRARKKATEAAARAAAKQLADDIVALLARPQQLGMSVEIRGVSGEIREKLGDAFERAVQRAGLKVERRKLDLPTSVLRYEGTAGTGTQDELELALRRAFRAEGLQDAVVLEATGAGVFAYRFTDPYRLLYLLVEGVDDDSQRAAGVEIADALAKLPGVDKVDRAFSGAEKAMLLTLKMRGRPSDLDAAILAAREGPLGALQLVTLVGEKVTYKLRKPVAPFVVEIHGIESRNVANVGIRIDEAVKGLKGVLDHERTQDPAQGLVKLKITFQGRPHQLEKALLEGLEKLPELPQLMAVVPGPGADLAYRAALSLNVAIRVRVEQVTPEIYRASGVRLVDLIAGLDGVRFVDRKYEPEHERIDLAVEGSIDPIDLDMRIWKAVRGIPELAKLAPGETRGAALGYLFLTSTPDDYGATILVSQLAAEAYAADGRQLVEAVRGLAGTKKVEAEYDKDHRELKITLRYKGPAHELEEALWKALEGRTFSKAFSPDRRVGSLIQISFVERRGDRSRAFVRIEGLTTDAARKAGSLLVARVKGLEGASEVEVDDQGERIEVRLWAKARASEVYDAVAAMLREDKALDPLVEGRLEGNVIVVRGPGGAGPGGARTGSVGLQPGGGRLSDLVAKLNPTVVLIQGRIPSGGQWLGTGFFVSSRGYILTNYHVAGTPSKGVPQEAVQLVVKTHDGRAFQAQFLDGNPGLDLALLKVAGEGFAAVSLGDSDLLKPGDGLIVIGHPHGLEFSVTTGIVSGMDRAKGRIQSSVNTNPGNSGGPVFDEAGRVVGVHVAGSVDQVAMGGQELLLKRPGINFHIPINHAAPLLQMAGVGPAGGTSAGGGK